MGIVVKFRRHARTFSRRRAKLVNCSGETAADLAFSVPRIEDHRSGGIQSRCHHLVTIPADAPISKAKAVRAPCASFGPQSSITSRNELSFAMPNVLGQSVLKRKRFLSLDAQRSLGHNVRMGEGETETQFKQAFTKRIKEARVARGWKQWQMAEALNMPQDKYKQYEGRTLLPHHLIGRFCLITHVDPVWLLTGRGEKPLRPIKAVENEQAPARPAKRRLRSKRAA